MVDEIIATEEMELMIRDPSQPPDNTRREPLAADEQDGTAAARNRRHRSLQDNQERLGVNTEHKTETMRKRHRGTFP